LRFYPTTHTRGGVAPAIDISGTQNKDYVEYKSDLLTLPSSGYDYLNKGAGKPFSSRSSFY